MKPEVLKIKDWLEAESINKEPFFVSEVPLKNGYMVDLNPAYRYFIFFCDENGEHLIITVPKKRKTLHSSEICFLRLKGLYETNNLELAIAKVTEGVDYVRDELKLIPWFETMKETINILTKDSSEKATDDVKYDEDNLPF